jgi:hypothetical protein
MGPVEMPGAWARLETDVPPRLGVRCFLEPRGLLWTDGGRLGRWRLSSPSALSVRFGHLDGCVQAT